MDPYAAGTYSNRGAAYDDLKQYEKAIEDYNKAIELDTNLAHSYYNRGDTYINLQQYEQAIADFDKTIELDQKFTAAHLDRGHAHYYLNQYEKAIEDYNKVIKLDPNDAQAYNDRELALIELHGPAKEWNTKGIDFGKSGEYQKAMGCFDKAIELYPNFTWAYTNRGST